MIPSLETTYNEYVSERLSGSFGEMGSWPLVLPYLQHKKVLDVGCSDGLYLQHFSPDSMGIEQMPELVKKARQKRLQVENCDIIEGLRRQPTDSFEAIFFSHAMEHIDAPIEALREINRVLPIGGTLILGLPIENCFIRHLLRHDYFDGTHVYAFTIRNSKKLLSLTGFKVNEVIYHLPKFRGASGLRINRIWNLLPLPFKEYFSMAYWIYASKESHSSNI